MWSQDYRGFESRPLRTFMTQKDALELLKLGYSVYLTGEAGSGKTYLLNKYIKSLHKQKVEVGITASTGIAATHLGGTTIDSWSGLGMRDEITHSDLIYISQNHNLQKRIKKTKILIIDEVSMLHGKRLDSINKICQAIRKNNSPFGGMQVVLSGDFFQLPPVSEERRNYDYVYKSNVWHQMNPKIIYLESQYRQTDPVFNDVLSALRENRIEERIKNILHQTINNTFSGSIVPTKLYTHNVDVDQINKNHLDQINQKPYEYVMTAVGHEKLVEFLKRGCLVPEHLTLKKGAQVMFVRNNYKAGYFNGTVGKVVGFDRDKTPVVETYEKKKIHVKPDSWNIMENNKILAEIKQIPLRLAWAITIHKSQGMTLSCAEIDLSKSFVHGMGYVALSRLRHLKGLRLLGMNDLALSVNPEVTEVDKILRQKSIQAVEDLKKMGWFKRFFARRKFMYHLTS